LRGPCCFGCNACSSNTPADPAVWHVRDPGATPAPAGGDQQMQGAGGTGRSAGRDALRTSQPADTIAYSGAFAASTRLLDAQCRRPRIDVCTSTFLRRRAARPPLVVAFPRNRSQRERTTRHDAAMGELSGVREVAGSPKGSWSSLRFPPTTGGTNPDHEGGGTRLALRRKCGDQPGPSGLVPRFDSGKAASAHSTSTRRTYIS